MKHVTKIAAVGTVAIALFVGGALRPWSGDDDPTAPPGTAVESYSPGSASAGAADIDELERRVAAAPDDSQARASLGLAYLSQTTATADPTWLTKADDELTTALDLGGKGRLAALIGMASLSNARHEFRESAGWARKAIALDPFSSAPHGLLGDALFQLGDYRASDRAYEEMVSLRPDAGSYVRIAYARSFRGDTVGAKRAMRLALQAAGQTGTTAALMRHQFGDIFIGTGQWRQAARQNRIGTKLAPGFVPPKVGIAEAAFGRGDVERATALLEEATSDLPSLEYLIKLGDLYSIGGNQAKAEAQWDLAAQRLADYRTHGMQPDVDLIVFYADHGFRLKATLEEARALYADRPTPAAADALAWALHANHHERGALRLAGLALRGPAPSPGHLVHAAQIADALGYSDRSEALLARAEQMGAFSTPSIAASIIE
jgi:tetratricopeptide (TPR) repeat protein